MYGYLHATRWRTCIIGVMPAVCFYFQVHQPYRLKKYRFFDIGHDRDYFSGLGDGNLNNEWVLNKVATKCYLPTNEVMLNLLKEHPEFKISYSLSGVFMEQIETMAPHVLDSFKALVDTGQVELLSETYYHSLSFLFSKDEFRNQVAQHRDTVRRLFGVTPTMFRNTELIYNNDIGREVSQMGFKGVLAEGADHILGWRSSDFVYSPKDVTSTKLLLKNYKLSDDVAFRFSDKGWKEHPLDTGKYAQWISAKNGSSQIINLFMDYETFGEHQWEDTGIFNFLRHLPRELLKNGNNYFVTPSEAVERFDSVGEIDAPHYYSWADMERDLSAWLDNPLQHDASKKLYELEKQILSSGDAQLIDDWRKLQTSDHLYYMCTKYFNDGDVHAYFNPYESPYDAFISFMNVLQDLKMRLHKTKTPTFA